jgi:hypothetical protein
MPIGVLGRPVGGIVKFPGQELPGNPGSQEIVAGPRGTFIMRVVPLTGPRSLVELAMGPENVAFTLEQMPLPIFLPPDHTLRLSRAGDRAYWCGYDAP